MSIFFKKLKTAEELAEQKKQSDAMLTQIEEYYRGKLSDTFSEYYRFIDPEKEVDEEGENLSDQFDEVWRKDLHDFIWNLDKRFDLGKYYTCMR